jgi:hypothetical protein
MMADLNTRLRRIEQQHAEIRWCRCPYDRERERAESLRAMETGEPTPGECDVCGGARVRIHYVEWGELYNRTFPMPERE